MGAERVFVGCDGAQRMGGQSAALRGRGLSHVVGDVARVFVRVFCASQSSNGKGGPRELSMAAPRIRLCMHFVLWSAAVGIGAVPRLSECRRRDFGCND